MIFFLIKHCKNDTYYQLILPYNNSSRSLTKVIDKNYLTEFLNSISYLFATNCPCSTWSSVTYTMPSALCGSEKTE